MTDGPHTHARTSALAGCERKRCDRNLFPPLPKSRTAPNNAMGPMAVARASPDGAVAVHPPHRPHITALCRRRTSSCSPGSRRSSSLGCSASPSRWELWKSRQ